MQTLIPKKDGPRKWRRIGLLLGLLAAAAIVLVWFTRPAPEKSSHSEHEAKSKSSYRNRNGWRNPDAKPGAQAPATPPIRGTVYDMDGSTIAGASVVAATFEN